MKLSPMEQAAVNSGRVLEENVAKVQAEREVRKRKYQVGQRVLVRWAGTGKPDEFQNSQSVEFEHAATVKSVNAAGTVYTVEAIYDGRITRAVPERLREVPATWEEREISA